MEVRKICQWCGKPFIAQKTTTCYCSHQCSNLGYKERIRERKRQLKRSQELLQPRQAAEGQDFFSFAQAAKLMGVTRQYIYKLVKESKLRASRISGKKSLIRRADIELMMKTKPYERVVPKEDFNISEYYTAEEIVDKYKVNAKWVWTYTRQHKVPKVRIRQFNYYSKKHIDAAFAKYEVDSDLTEWYTPEEIQAKYGMTRVAIRSQVYRNNIPSRRSMGRYSTQSSTSTSRRVPNRRAKPNTTLSRRRWRNSNSLVTRFTAFCNSIRLTVRRTDVLSGS